MHNALMSPAQRTALACFFFGVALTLLWVPWTSEIGYSWLWSKPKLRPISSDIVADARRHWEAELNSINPTAIDEKWVLAGQDTQAGRGEKVRLELKHALELARLRQAELNRL